LEVTCQRCHEPLRGVERYCSVCGLPQLIYIASEIPQPAAGDAEDGLASGIGSTGLIDGIAWRPALKAAVILAVPAGVLCYSLTTLGLFWMVTASAWAVALYARRAQSDRLPLRVGARIGLVTGLLASWLAIGVEGIAIWVARFVLHQGGQMDSLHDADVDKSLQVGRQIWASMGIGSAEVTQMSQVYRNWMLSAEGRAGEILSQFIFGAVLLIFFATLGGAVGARLVGRRPRPTS
jgi:hypothetical protein